ncbi:MAG: patatin-like phospholipase family protein [Phenylobacterium sp.]|uniref:patatin-like phospholipase family protein n=1 Tax=Phenylobacterium sp. TaxID=1871053 RepID=UPI001222B70C|nr:patatin-like phospholipase family protein [Phenylobacterium sp.]TAL36516.1 MAG: patatin-like phospholipase family protein [Phenylobacterium sp.]
MKAAAKTSTTIDKARLGQIVLVFQGGGALGAYQAGVYQALQEAGVEPDWVIGTSIGAINAALIAGNAPEQRLERLREFWARMTHSRAAQFAGMLPGVGALAANAMTVANGLEAFFRPNPWAFLGMQMPLGSELAGYYSTDPLEKTLGELIDPGLMNAGRPRLTVGAANVQTGQMRYFDSREDALTVRHVMASGALPPAFPAVRIDGELYWDGGILSNTPVEAVFDDKPRRSGVVFAVHMWAPNGPEPDSIWSVLSRQKDLQYSSRAITHIARQKQIHKLRHIIAMLAEKLPPDVRATNEARELAAYGCPTQMHVIRLLSPPLAGEDHSKDIDFSPLGIRSRWEAGYAHTARVLAQAPWMAPVDPMEGIILHEAEAGRMTHDPCPANDQGPSK